jgi:polyhydroxybutyrate depolymerase
MKMLLVPLAFVLAVPPEPIAPGDYVRKLKQGKTDRSYVFYVPKSYDARKPTPIVLALHGATMNADAMVYLSGLNSKSDDAGFVVVYPNGVLATWNSGGQTFNAADDVGFIGMVLDDLERYVNVDKKRIYAAGLSNGAMMCYRLAAEMSDRIAAIATVAGTMAINECKPKRAVPVIHFHGTKDTLVPPDGPNKKLPLLIRFRPLDDTIKTWVKINGCDEAPEVTALPNLAEDKLQVTRTSYNKGRNGAEVVLYMVDGAGHTWPGMDTTLPVLGRTTMNISANDLMWEFFKKHPMK